MVGKLILSVGFVLAIEASVASASITYNLVDYYTDQEDNNHLCHHLSGTIETNGATDRRLTAADIVKATFIIDGTKYTATSYNFGGGRDWWYGPWATSTQLLATSDCYFGMIYSEGSATKASVYWHNVPSWNAKVYWGGDPSVSWYKEYPPALIANNWVIAEVQSVPEPATLIIWSLIGALGIGWCWRRRAA
jgi:hypothetical protein